ncbi:MAG TPA: YgjV family protein [Candidatus Faecimonas intestinavium]|nr:YgjV family protein [Candidatus Faecimonas intestinavium]
MYQSVSSLLYAFQYSFLKTYTGCFMNLICMIRNLVFQSFGNYRFDCYNH